MTTLPRPPADLEQRFTYHPPTPEQPPVYELLRDLTHQLALVIATVTPDSAERRRAIERVELVGMTANAAIARHGLTDAGTAPPTRILQAANDELRHSKPDSAVVCFCPAGWHSRPGAGPTEPQPQAWQQASPYDDTRGPGWGDGEDHDTGRCCPWCAGDLSDHNGKVHAAGYALGERHSSPYGWAPQVHTGTRRSITVDARALDSRGLLVLPGDPPPSEPITAQTPTDAAQHPEGVPPTEHAPLLIIAVAEPGTAEVLSDAEPRGVLFVPLGTKLHSFGPQL